MATERARRAAKLIHDENDDAGGNCLWIEEEEVANLIDTAAGLPELEARVAELTQELSHIKRYMDLCDVEQFNLAQHAFRSRDKALKRESKLMAERDAALRKLEAVIEYTDNQHDGTAYWTSEVLRLARGDK